VGEDGIAIEELDRADADALVLTPSHQWPTGAVLAADARVAVLRWAETRGALIVEDDYDAEYRYDRAPIGAMQGLAPHRVIYAGTASKTLAPGLRLGWLVAPPRLVGDLGEAKSLADRGSPVLDQLTFADFMQRGEFDRHLRRMRPVYRRRRDTLITALRELAPELEPGGIAAGLHLVVYLPSDLGENALIDEAARRGVGLYGLAPYRVSRRGPAGLIFGYATLAERTIVEGIETLAETIAEVRSRDIPSTGSREPRSPGRTSRRPAFASASSSGSARRRPVPTPRTGP
jgi:GntR family transcriptional regulator/MocR family aminotransferase